MLTLDDMPNFIHNITVKTKYGAMAATVTSFVIVASIYSAWAYISRTWRKSGVLKRSMSVGVLHGGKLALERLVDYHNARADQEYLEAAENELTDLIQEDQPDFKKLQRTAARLEMSAKDAVAVEKLENAWKKAQDDKKQHEAYELEMLLVEMLIYKGDFERARQCKCLQEKNISDARRPLYEAIIYLMLERPKESKFQWEQFNYLRGNFQWPPCQQESEIYEVIEHFDKFENLVRLLKEDIQKTKKKAVR